MQNTNTTTILLTGATGMIGSYILREFADCQVTTLGRSADNDIRVDLSASIPSLSRRFDLVVHCAGTTDEATADKVNRIGTLNLLSSLESQPPRHFVFISSLSVYGKTEGTDIDEQSMTLPVTEYGRSKLDAERAIKAWCDCRNVVLTILRPALTFGNGITGKAAEMFDAIHSGRYFHIRGNQARRSLVMADDVAKACRLTYQEGGVYNVTDGLTPTVIELADAMAAHSGKDKRIIYCPLKLAKLCAKIGDIIPPLGRMLNSDKLSILTSTLTFSNARLIEKTGLQPHNTIDVIARRSTTYPYQHND